MLNITINTPVTIKYARKGTQKDGTPYTLVTICESDNSESKSRSTIKAWGTELDEAITDGCKAVLKSMEGVRVVHEKVGERYGKPQFRDSYQIIGAVFAPWKE